MFTELLSNSLDQDMPASLRLRQQKTIDEELHAST